jgi:hypothetical protein
LKPFPQYLYNETTDLSLDNSFLNIIKMVIEMTQKINSNDNSTTIKFVPSWMTNVFSLLIIPILELVFGLIFENQCNESI